MTHSQSEQKVITALREALRRRSGGRKSILGGEKLLNWLFDHFRKGSLELDVEDLEFGFSVLREDGEIKARDWNAQAPGNPLSGKVLLHLEPLLEDPHVTLWRSVIVEKQFPKNVRSALLKKNVANRFKGLTRADVEKLLDGLDKLRDKATDCVTEYMLSAQTLLGSSKILGCFGKAERTVLGLEVGRFAPSPKYLAVAGPVKPKAVVLVENPNSFEAAVQAGAHEKLAWACTYGFGLGNEKSDQDGGMLVTNLVEYRRHVTVLVRAGDPPRDIGTLLGHPNLYFWGDLDLTGLRIFDNLKKHYPQLRLSALYESMIQALKDGRCHPYVKCVGKDGQKNRETQIRGLQEDVAKRLALLCKDRAVDQEIVSERFKSLGMLPLIYQ